MSNALCETKLTVDEVLVVLDGSIDDSQEMLETLVPDFPVPLKYKWQDNAGLASARNQLIKMATGRVVWLLDDDMVVDANVLIKHLSWDREKSPILTGPCYLEGHVGLKNYYDSRWSRLEQEVCISRPDDMSFANTSAVTEVLRTHPFDDNYKGYGFEDYELAVRLIRVGIILGYDPLAAVSHLHVKSTVEMLKDNREEGKNRVAFASTYSEHKNVALELPPRKYRKTLCWLTNMGFHRFLWWAANTFIRVNGRLNLGPSSILVSLSHDCAIHSGIASAGGKMILSQ